MLSRRILLLTVGSIVAVAIGVGSLTGFIAWNELRLSAQSRIERTHQLLQSRMVTFDLLIAEEERSLEPRMTDALRRMADYMHAQNLTAATVNASHLAEMETLATEAGADHIYVIDRSGVITSTNFAPDQGLDLGAVSADMSAFLENVYESDEPIIDRFNFSIHTGDIRKYGYLSPEGADYIVEVSVDLKNLLHRNHSDRFVSHLFEGLFDEELMADQSLLAVDVLMANKFATVSLLTGSNVDHAGLDHNLYDLGEGRLTHREGNRLEVYQGVQRLDIGGSETRHVISKVVYDLSHRRNVMLALAGAVVGIIVFVCVPVFLVAQHLTRQHLIRPVSRVAQHMSDVGEGQYDPLSWPHDDEIGCIVDAANLMQNRVRRRENELRELNSELEARVAERTYDLKTAAMRLHQEATLDHLTDLMNRREYDRRYAEEWRRHRREGTPLAVLFLDIDYFKRFNDMYGHVAGDNCLVVVSKALRQCLSRPGDFIARYGGEEFVVILSNTETEGARMVAESLRTAVSGCNLPHDEGVGARVTISIGGVSCIPDEEADPGGLLTEADRMLYQAKFEGRDCVIMAKSEG